MPTTTYTASPDSLHDPIGRLADFARFAELELERLRVEMVRLGVGHQATPGTLARARTVEDAVHQLAGLLHGFTTSDAPELEEPAPPRLCEFGCGRPATLYGGYRGADQWAGRACDECAAAADGFGIWERLTV